MTKAELIERIARNRDLPPDITKKCVAEIVDIAFAELAAYFIRAKVTRSSSPRFAFPNFGTFTKKKRQARRGVNPRTLEPMEIDASSTLDFKPASALKKAMNQDKDASSSRRRTRKRSSKNAETKGGRRRLRSREEVELESLDDASLPDAPLRRAGRSRKSLGRTG